MPGRVATFATCSRARSSRALRMRSSEANTTPGTRIPGTVPVGIRHTNSSTRSGSRAPAPPPPASDIEEHAGLPAPLHLPQGELVVRRGLQLQRTGCGVSIAPLDGGHEGGGPVELDPDPGHSLRTDLGPVDQLVHQRHQQGLGVGGVEGDPLLSPWGRRTGPEDLDEAETGVLERLLDRRAGGPNAD